MKYCPLLTLLFTLLFNQAFAKAPVVDLTQQMVGANDDQKNGTQQYVNNGSLSERVGQLETKVQNLIEMDVAGQLEALKEKVQHLQGRIDMLSHRLDKLKDQQESYYNDLDQRLTNGGSGGQVQRPKAQRDNETSQQTGHPQQTLSSKQQARAEKAYEKAFFAVQKQQYSRAIKLYDAFLRDYPNSRYAANAHYWLGELYYVKGDGEKAKQHLTSVISEYSRSSKVPAAKLKLGLIALDEDRTGEAKQILSRVMEDYPQTSAAKLAKRYLDQINNTL